MARVFASHKKWYLMPPCLTFSIIRYGSKVSGALQGKKSYPLLHLSVVAIEKEDFRSPATTVSQHTYIYTKQSHDLDLSLVLSLVLLIYIYIYIYMFEFLCILDMRSHVQAMKETSWLIVARLNFHINE